MRRLIAVELKNGRRFMGYCNGKNYRGHLYVREEGCTYTTCYNIEDVARVIASDIAIENKLMGVINAR
jgi:hypothetical protein